MDARRRLSLLLVAALLGPSPAAATAFGRGRGPRGTPVRAVRLGAWKAPGAAGLVQGGAPVSLRDVSSPPALSEPSPPGPAGKAQAAPAGARERVAEGVRVLDGGPRRRSGAGAVLEWFWSGSRSDGGPGPEPVDPGPDPVPRRGRDARVTAALGASAAGLHAAAQASPALIERLDAGAAGGSLLGYVPQGLEVSAILLLAFVVNRVLNGVLAGSTGGRRAPLAGFLVSAAVWGGALIGSMAVVAPEDWRAVVAGAGALFVSTVAEEMLGNKVDGARFIVEGAYGVGDRITVDGKTGVIREVGIDSVTLDMDDGSRGEKDHSALASEPVVLEGPYRPAPGREDGRPLEGVLAAVWASLDARFWLAAAAVAALTAAPLFLGAAAAGWTAALAHGALALALLWATRRAHLAALAAVDRLAERNKWRPESRTLARLAAGAVLWSVGGGAALSLLSVPLSLLGMTAAGLLGGGLRFLWNRYVKSAAVGARVLARLKTGDVREWSLAGGAEAVRGRIVAMTSSHVIVGLGEPGPDGRHPRHYFLPNSLALRQLTTYTPKPRDPGAE